MNQILKVLHNKNHQHFINQIKSNIQKKQKVLLLHKRKRQFDKQTSFIFILLAFILLTCVFTLNKLKIKQKINQTINQAKQKIKQKQIQFLDQNQYKRNFTIINIRIYINRLSILIIQNRKLLMRQDHKKLHKSSSKINPVKKIVFSKVRSMRSIPKLQLFEEHYESSEQYIDAHQAEAIKQATKISKNDKNSQKKSKKKNEPTIIIQNVQKLQQKQVNEANQVLIKIEVEKQIEVVSAQFLAEKIKKKRNVAQQSEPIFFSEGFNKITEIDFRIYHKILCRKKMFSTILVNEMGNVIYADKLGSQHFEGSLNNLPKNSIQSMILECNLEQFYQKARRVSKTNTEVFKLIIYSKNSKRRYSKSIKTFVQNNEEIFNRFLKCISTKVTPIEVTLTNFQDYQGYWNHNLITLNQPLKCYLLRTRPSYDLPDLNKLSFENDKRIRKFKEYTMKKVKQPNQSSDKKQDEVSNPQQKNEMIAQEENQNQNQNHKLQVSQQRKQQTSQQKKVITRSYILIKRQ